MLVLATDMVAAVGVIFGLYAIAILALSVLAAVARLWDR